MKRKSRAFRPGATSLEPRAMTSAVDVLPLAATTTVIAGRLPGTYRAGKDNRAVDAPLRVNLSGKGRIQGQQLNLSGALDFGGLRGAGIPDITGTVRLKGVRGTITLQLSGNGGTAPIPKGRFTLDATVVGSTGIYTGLEGDGTAIAQFAKNTLRNKKVGAPIAGNATFSLSLNAVVA